MNQFGNGKKQLLDDMESLWAKMVTDNRSLFFQYNKKGKKVLLSKHNPNNKTIKVHFVKTIDSDGIYYSYCERSDKETTTLHPAIAKTLLILLVPHISKVGYDACESCVQSLLSD